MNKKFIAPALIVASVLAVAPMTSFSADTKASVSADGSRTVGTTAKDAAITASVKTKLLADSEVAGMKIDVDTFDKVVTLSGSVASEGLKDKAATLAKNADGVSSVKNELVVAK